MLEDHMGGVELVLDASLPAPGWQLLSPRAMAVTPELAARLQRAADDERLDQLLRSDETEAQAAANGTHLGVLGVVLVAMGRDWDIEGEADGAK